MGKVSLAIKNLDKSHKARMARAKEQGFDVDNTVYHGTSGNDIYDFDMGKARNSKAVYVTKSPWVAQNEGGYLDESFKDILGVDEWEKSNEKFNTSIYPLHIRGNIAGKEDIKEALNVTGAGSKNDDRVIEYLKSKGFDGAADSNYETLIFDPKNIRSKFAQFDPAKKDSSNLLANVGAGVGTAGIIGAGMAPEDAEASFIGQAAKTFNKQALKQAELMEAQGAPREAIWKATGYQHNAPMMRGADGKWRQEISDKTLRINEEMPDDITEWLSQMDDATYPVQMDDFVDTPVYNAYPDIADAGVTLNAGTNTGYFTPSTGRYNLPGGHDHEGYLRFPELQRSVAGHELQHGIQEIEGFAKGGSPDEFVSDLAALSKLNDMSFADMDDFQKAMYKDLKEKYKGVSDPDAQYRRLAGEAEARNVQTRLDMDMKERIDTPMNRTLDVPEDELIVRNNAAKSYLAKSSERRKKMSDKKMQRDIMRRGQYRKDTGQYFQTKGEAAQDAMTTIAKPLAAQIISGVTSVGLSPFTDPDDLAEYIKDYTQQWTHTPEGRRSAEILGKLGHNLQPVMDIVGKYARGAIAAGGLATGGSLDDAVNLIENDKRSINEIMGQKTLDATGSPAAAAFVHAAPDALL